MKKTFNINLSQCAFIIDDDAFELLKNYLDTIKHSLDAAGEDSEIAEDIEGRIAEHFLNDTDNGKRIVTFKLVESVIERLGRPEEFIEVEAKEEAPDDATIINEEATTPPPFRTEIQSEKTRKRLYRDPRDKILGGVCNGIATYLNIDVIWVRLAFVASFFLSASVSFFIYFILWAIVPEAKTPIQFMELEGESPTLSNIAKSVTGSFKNNESAKGAGTVVDERKEYPFLHTIMKIVGWCVKVIMIIFSIIAVPVLFALTVALIGCIFALLAYGIAGISLIPLDLIGIGIDLPYSPAILLVAAIAVLTAIGIPFFIILMIMFNSYKGRPIIGKATGITLSIIWILSLAATWLFSLMID